MEISQSLISVREDSWSKKPTHEGIRKQRFWWAVVPSNNQECQNARSQILEGKVRQYERLCQGMADKAFGARRSFHE